MALKHRSLLILIVALGLLGAAGLRLWRATQPAPNAIPAARHPAAQRALAWCKAQQQADGSLPNGDWTLSLTVQAVPAIAATGQAPAEWRSNAGHSPIDYLEAHAGEAATPGMLGRLILAAAAARRDPRAFGGVDLVARLAATYVESKGSYGGEGNIAEHTLAMVSLQAAGEAVAPGAMAWLKDKQNDDGGWGWAEGQSSDASSTAWAVQALLVAGEPPSADALAHAVAYLRTLQNADGGFANQKPAPAWGSEDSDANSTATVIQALAALGDRPAGWAWRGPVGGAGSGTPFTCLLGFQRADGGLAFNATGESDLLATVQAIPALLEQPLAARSASTR